MCKSIYVIDPFVFCSMLADKLNMSSDDAEKWIVNLIRNARLDAKIDSQLVRAYSSVWLKKLFVERNNTFVMDIGSCQHLMHV